MFFIDNLVLLHSQVDEFEILEGDLQGLVDTAEFLRRLTRLDEEGDVRASDLAEKPQERERLAAGCLFRWEVISHNYNAKASHTMKYTILWWLILKGPGVCLYGIHGDLHEPPTSIEVKFYVIYGIVSIFIKRGS